MPLCVQVSPKRRVAASDSDDAEATTTNNRKKNTKKVKVKSAAEKEKESDEHEMPPKPPVNFDRPIAGAGGGKPAPAGRVGSNWVCLRCTFSNNPKNKVLTHPPHPAHWFTRSLALYCA